MAQTTGYIVLGIHSTGLVSVYSREDTFVTYWINGAGTNEEIEVWPTFEAADKFVDELKKAGTDWILGIAIIHNVPPTR